MSAERALDGAGNDCNSHSSNSGHSGMGGTDAIVPERAEDDCADDYAECSWCGGEWYLQECDDPIQCCSPRCDGQWHPCDACQGTGLAKHQVMW